MLAPIAIKGYTAFASSTVTVSLARDLKSIAIER
jgi:hypothetical protein